MKIKYYRKRKPTVLGGYSFQSPSTKKIYFCAVGDTIEIPDEVGFEILKRDGDIFEKIEEPKPKPKAKPAARKQGVVKANKMAKPAETKGD